MSHYLNGTYVLGASVPANEPYVLIHVTDLPGLVKAQAGATGSLALSFVPETIRGKVYATLVEKLDAALKEQGVKADVSVAYSPSTSKPPATDLFRGMLIGAGAVGGGYAIWKLVLKRLFTRK